MTKAQADKPRRAEQAGDLVPPAEAARNAEHGLELRSRFKRGGTSIGVARARDLKARKSLSLSTVKRMKSYFARHAVDKQAKGFGDADEPSAGYIAWLLWGGDAGRDWAEKTLSRLEESDRR